jgi:gliding motility-associated-like protein
MDLLRSLLKLSILMLLALWCHSSALATHLVGGEIFYEYLGNDTYAITLIVYRDCGPANSNNAQFDAQASIGFFNAQNNALVEDVLVSLQPFNVIEVPVELENPCFILPPDLCIERATYFTQVTLPQNEDGYYMVYQRCCRNPSIDNLVAPNQTGLTLYTTIPGTDLIGEESNSSAEFDNFPPAALCASAEFFFDHGATDADGDSLVYEFCNPYHGASADIPAPQPPDSGPYNNVVWQNDFSEDYQILSNPAFSINPETGYITGTATQIGQYVLGVCVSEYRNGVLINTSHRDFQFNVTLCDPNIIASIPEQESFCDGLTVSFENVSTNASFFEWDFGVAGIDTDVSDAANPSYTYPSPGLYTVRLIANPGWTCADTAFATFDARPPLEVSIEVGDGECEFPNVKYDFTATTNGTNNALYSWNFGPGSSPGSSNLQNPQNIILLQEQLNYQISLSVEDNGCFAQDEIELENPPEPISVINPQESFCAGLTYSFTSSSQNTTEYSWDFGTIFGGDFALIANPEFTFPDTGAYVITLISSAPFTCPDTATLNFEIFDLLNPFFESFEPQCLSSNEFDFFGEGNSLTSAEFSWNFGSSANIPTSTNQNPQNISFNEAGIFPVVLTITENGCTKTYTEDIWVVTDPNFIPIVESDPGCTPLLMSYTTEQESDTPIFYEWNFGDGNISNSQTGAHIFQNSGTYGITVLGYTVAGCIREIFFALEDSIVVHPAPIANFEILSEDLNILNPLVEVQNLSEDAISCNYFMSDGGESDDCDFTYSFIEGGYHTITQVVTNEFGCTASLVGRVFIDGFMFYAPNSFSPNNDGVNDYWIPVMTGVSAYECKIYDRWGTLIFETNDLDKAWTGDVRGGSNYAANGIYQFDIQFNDSAGLSRRKQGHICLFR